MQGKARLSRLEIPFHHPQLQICPLYEHRLCQTKWQGLDPNSFCFRITRNFAKRRRRPSLAMCIKRTREVKKANTASCPRQEMGRRDGRQIKTKSSGSFQPLSLLIDFFGSYRHHTLNTCAMVRGRETAVQKN